MSSQTEVSQTSSTPSRQEVTTLILANDGPSRFTITLVDLADNATVIGATEETILQRLVEIIADYSPRSVVDQTWSSRLVTLVSFEYLFPVMALGGLYSLAASQEPQSGASAIRALVSALLLGEASSAESPFSPGTLAILSNHVESMHVAPATIVIRKNLKEFSILTELSLAEAAGSDLFVEESTSYPRPGPTYLNPNEVSANLAIATEDFAPVRTPVVYGRIVGNAVVFGGGVVALDDRYVVTESLIYLVDRYRREFLTRIGESTSYLTTVDLAGCPSGEPELHVLTKQAWDRNYGHWLVDAFGRMSFLKEVLPAGEDPYYIVGNPSDPGRKELYRETLGAIGISESRLVYQGFEPVRYQRLLYISPATAGPLNHHPRIISFLDGLADHSATPADRVYLSRGRYSRRRLVNEAQIEPILARHGFKIIFPEELTLAEQIAAVENAAVIAGTFGAALTNIVFAPRGVSAVSINPESVWDDYFYDLTSHKDGAYFIVHGHETSDLENAADLEVDVALFESALEQAIEASTAGRGGATS